MREVAHLPSGGEYQSVLAGSVGVACRFLCGVGVAGMEGAVGVAIDHAVGRHEVDAVAGKAADVGVILEQGRLGELKLEIGIVCQSPAGERHLFVDTGQHGGALLPVQSLVGSEPLAAVVVAVGDAHLEGLQNLRVGGVGKGVGGSGGSRLAGEVFIQLHAHGGKLAPGDTPGQILPHKAVGDEAPFIGFFDLAHERLGGNDRHLGVQSRHCVNVCAGPTATLPVDVSNSNIFVLSICRYFTVHINSAQRPLGSSHLNPS